MNKKTIITTLLVLVATTSIVAQDLINKSVRRGGYSASGDRRANKEPSV